MAIEAMNKVFKTPLIYFIIKHNVIIGVLMKYVLINHVHRLPTLLFVVTVLLLHYSLCYLRGCYLFILSHSSMLSDSFQVDSQGSLLAVLSETLTVPENNQELPNAKVYASPLNSLFNIWLVLLC